MTDADLVRLGRALGDPTRVRILRAVAAEGTLCCGAIGRAVPVRPATISHHLRILTDAGLVLTRRDGQFINVRANEHRLAELRRYLGEVLLSGPHESPGRAPADAQRTR